MKLYVENLLSMELTEITNQGLLLNESTILLLKFRPNHTQSTSEKQVIFSNQIFAAQNDLKKV